MKPNRRRLLNVFMQSTIVQAAAAALRPITVTVHSSVMLNNISDCTDKRLWLKLTGGAGILHSVNLYEVPALQVNVTSQTVILTQAPTLMYAQTQSVPSQGISWC